MKLSSQLSELHPVDTTESESDLDSQDTPQSETEDMQIQCDDESSQPT